jgi:iron complex transport system ATP-binding protein
MELQLRGVACGYTTPILNNISFSVQTGQICCLLGPNGVGKTTLFKTILGLLKPLSGHVFMDGEDTARFSARVAARDMAYVSQFHTPPFPYKVREVVLLGRLSQVGYFGKVSAHDQEIAERAMEDMGILHLRDTVYTDISGGERQLVMIARALAQEPKFLIMDEPTASLDYGNMVRVVAKIRALKSRGIGVILTTHSPDQAFLYESQVALLRRGGEVVFGPAAEVINERNMRDAYGIETKIVEFFDATGRLVRMCSPLLD